MKKTIALILIVMFLTTTFAFAGQKYNSMSRRWETVPDNWENKYNPHNGSWSYQPKNARPEYNSFNNEWEWNSGHNNNNSNQRNFR